MTASLAVLPCSLNFIAKKCSAFFLHAHVHTPTMTIMTTAPVIIVQSLAAFTFKHTDTLFKPLMWFMSQINQPVCPLPVTHTAVTCCTCLQVFVHCEQQFEFTPRQWGLLGQSSIKDFSFGAKDKSTFRLGLGLSWVFSHDGWGSVGGQGPHKDRSKCLTDTERGFYHQSAY